MYLINFINSNIKKLVIITESVKTVKIIRNDKTLLKTVAKWNKKYIYLKNMDAL